MKKILGSTSRGHKKLRPAIYCHDPTAVTETFVRRHITLLNDGHTRVLGEVKIDGKVLDEILGPNCYVPVLQERQWSRRACRLLGRYPVSKRLAAYLWKNLFSGQLDSDAFDYNLFEFGYLAARHWDIALFSQKPFFIYFRGIDASKLLSDAFYVRTLKTLAERCTGMIFVAPVLQRNLESSGIPVVNSMILPSGVDTEMFAPGEKNYNKIISIGRFVEKKAHEDTLRMFSLLHSGHPELRLAIFGDGPLLQKSKALAAALGLANSVEFAGSVDHVAIKRALSGAAVYVQSSKTSSDGDSEGFPSSIQEALASGAVVVTTRHAGARDFLVHEKTAMLSDESDFSAMAANVLKLLNNRDLMRSIAHNGRSYAERVLDANVGIRKLESFFFESIKARPSK